MLTALQVAERAGVSDTAICRWLKEGRFTAQRDGSAWSISEKTANDIVTYAQERRGNRAPLRVTPFTKNAFVPHNRTMKYRKEKLARNIREIKQRKRTGAN